MATTAQQIFESAVARSTVSDPGKLVQDGELIIYLNRRFQSLFAQQGLLQKENTLAKTTGTFAGAPPSFTLPVDIVNVVRVEKSDGTRVYLIKVEEKDRTTRLAPAAFRQGNSIVSCASTVGGVSDPIATDVWNVYYNDAPATLSALSSTLDTRFPVRFENILVTDLAIYCETKSEQPSATRLQQLNEELGAELKAFGLLLGGSNTARQTSNADRVPGARQ